MDTAVSSSPTADAAAPFSGDEQARLEFLLSEIAERVRVGEFATDLERSARAAFDDLVAAETDARESFSAFYASLMLSGVGAQGATINGGEQTNLPDNVAQSVNQWVEARRVWENLARRLLAEIPLFPADILPAFPVRHDRNTLGAAPSLLRVPTAATVKDAIAALFAPHLWQTTAGGDALAAQVNETHLRIEMDDALDFGPERAIQQITKQGASIAQTFLTLASLWQEKCAGQSHETYLNVYVSDLLRYQGRRETPRGGYHRKDLLAKGREIYLLSRISVPKSDVVIVENGQRQVRTLSIGRLLSLESLDAAFFEPVGGGDVAALESADPIPSVPNPTNEATANDFDGEEGKTVLQFRYHLGREVYDWIGGATRQYTQISSHLLKYHPIRQKYQVLLGFCLAYYDRVNRKNAQPVRRLRLPALLNLAAIPIPERRIGEFLASIEDALNDLSRDGVVPSLHLEKPEGWTTMIGQRRTREVLEKSVVVFPRLLAAPSPESKESAKIAPKSA